MDWRLARFLSIVEKEGFAEAISRSYQYFKVDVLQANRKLRVEILDGIYRPIFERKYGTGIDVLDQDWDNLIVLDAYRYDYFEEYSRFDGELSRVLTHGNWSMEWVLQNFQGRDLTDTAIVSANPFYERLDEDSVFMLESLEDEDPAITTERVLDLNEKYPNKRLIIHYMTPHQPHRGEISQELADEDEEFADIWGLFRNGEISKSKMIESYVQNIEIAEDHAESLLDELTGKTVITSDHGENLGETQFGLQRLDHGHETPECRFVPWIELPYDERKTVKPDEPVGFNYEGVIGERLKDLGYL